MPIFEYACETCNHKFEKLIRNGSTEVDCPQCQGTKLRKLFSAFATVNSDSMPSFGGGDYGMGDAGDGGSCGRCGSTERRCE